VSKAWPGQLKAMITNTQEIGGALATASVDRMLRTDRDWIMVQDSNVPIFICDDASLGTTTPSGKCMFGKKALEGQCKAETCGVRVKKARVVCKKRGQTLGTHNPKTKEQWKLLKNSGLPLNRSNVF